MTIEQYVESFKAISVKGKIFEIPDQFVNSFKALNVKAKTFQHIGQGLYRMVGS